MPDNSAAQQFLRDKLDLAPGVPTQAMGATPAAQGLVPHAAPAMSGLAKLIDSVRNRTQTFFGGSNQPAPLAPSPRMPVPQAGAMRTSSLEGGLDSLQQRSTQLATAPQKPIIAPLPAAMGGTPAFDYRAYLNEMSKRDIGGK